MASRSSDVPDGKVVDCLNKRLRALNKKLKNISGMEVSIAKNKTLNKDQEVVYKSKPFVLFAIEELEKLRKPLEAAVAEEINLGTRVKKPEEVGEILKLVYFGSLFDASHERQCCLSYVDVLDVGNDLLGENHLNLISKVKSLVVSRLLDTGLSHKDALDKCVEHAKLWLSGSNQPIEAGSNVTYGLLKEKLVWIMASPYVTTMSPQQFDMSDQQKVKFLDGPVLNLINKRLRALNKKLKNISGMEVSIAKNKTLNKDQEVVYKSKPYVLFTIEELEKLRKPLEAAVTEEMNLGTRVKKLESESDEVGEILKLVYFGSLFDASHERQCCLSYVDVSDVENDFLGENHLNLISKVKSLVVSRLLDTGLSHKDALDKCVEHAKLWLSGSNQPIEAGSNVTYGLLKENLVRIMASPYVTTMSETIQAQQFDVSDQRKGITHVVEYTISDVTRMHPNLGVVKGKVSAMMVCMDVSIVGFPGKLNAIKHLGLASDHPFTIPSLQLMYEVGNSTVISTTHDCGTPLVEFVDKQGDHFWEYDSGGMYVRPAKVFRTIGRQAGDLLYRLHKGGICIGGSLKDSIFVKGDGAEIPYYLTVMGSLTEYPKDPITSETPGFSEAVWRDLFGFVDFVKYVEAVKIKENPQKPHNCIDLKLFYSLLPTAEDRPSSDDEIKTLSYFMCHTSLFWDYDQRFAFCNGYYHLRKMAIRMGLNGFDIVMDFQKYNEMDDWHKKIEIGVLSNVYNRRHRLYQNKNALVIFWRHAVTHHVKDRQMSSNVPPQTQAPPLLEAADVDEFLLKTFPFAMPIAYFEMYESFSKVKHDVVQILSDGDLDYSRSEM